MDLFIYKAYAQVTIIPLIPRPASMRFQQFVESLLQFMLLIAGALAVAYLFWAGIQYITAAGNAEKAEQARNAIIHAVIGIFVILIAYLIIGWVTNLAGGNPNP